MVLDLGQSYSKCDIALAEVEALWHQYVETVLPFLLSSPRL